MNHSLLDLLRQPDSRKSLKDESKIRVHSRPTVVIKVLLFIEKDGTGAGIDFV